MKNPAKMDHIEVLNHIGQLNRQSDLKSQEIKLLKQRIEQLERDNVELTNLFIKEHEKLALDYIKLENDVVSGVYFDNTPEGSVWDEKVWTDGVIKEITDPIFTTHKKALQQRYIEQQIKALEGALESYVTAKFYPTTYAIQAFNDGVNHLYFHIQEKIEQLRKGVE